MEVYRPQTLEDALKLLSAFNIIPFAGGTDLMVQNRTYTGLKPDFKKDIMFLGEIDELKQIKLENNIFKIGAMCSISDLLQLAELPVFLLNALKEFASPSVRNSATIGGNICNASPAGDALPALYILNAVLKLVSLNKTRYLTLDEFIKSPGTTSIKDNEILHSINFTVPDFNLYYYKKVAQKKINSISKLSFCALAKADERIRDIRIAFGAVAGTVIRAKGIENSIISSSEKEFKSNISNYINEYAEMLSPISDLRSTRSYRYNVSIFILRDFFENIIKSMNHKG